ncbi:MAG: NUDIX hydrolase [Pseudomonadales bacterium]
MKYCTQCGGTVSKSIPQGDNRERFVCGHCQHIHYQNPRIIAGCLPFFEDQVLLCRRAIEPRRGMWTLPAGFLENGESISDGAVRETLEEANARVRVDSIYTIFSLPHISQVYVFYRAQLLDLDFSAGEESLETKLFREQEIPWDLLSFAAIEQTLTAYFSDLKHGQYQLREGTIDPRITTG